MWIKCKPHFMNLDKPCPYPCDFDESKPDPYRINFIHVMWIKSIAYPRLVDEV